MTEVLTDPLVPSTPSTLPQVDDGNFRIQNRQVHLTYAGHINPNDYLAWFSPKFPLELYSIVHETGATNYPHTHILIRFTKTFQSRNSRIFDYNNIHPNIRKVTTDLHWRNTVKYHSKQGTPFTNIPPIIDTVDIPPAQQVWSNDTLQDALLNTCTKLSQAGGVIALWDSKPSDYGVEPDVTWKPWQRDLYNEITTPCTDSRKVIWYYDPIGNSGKTFFAKHMHMYHNAFVTTKANAYHVATALQRELFSGNKVLIVIFNFTRQTENHKVYQCIESLKDGLITSEKYRGTTLCFPSPHVVVFANYLPDTSQMSSDRWDVRTISTDGSTVNKLYSTPIPSTTIIPSVISSPITAPITRSNPIIPVMPRISLSSIPTSVTTGTKFPIFTSMPSAITTPNNKITNTPPIIPPKLFTPPVVPPPSFYNKLPGNVYPNTPK